MSQAPSLPPLGHADPHGQDPASAPAGTRFPLGRILLALAVLAVVALLTARPAWHAFKRMRAESFGRESEKLVAGQQWTLAFERSRSALQLDPASPRALRTAALLHSRMQSESAFRYFDALLNTPAATALDRENYASLALQLRITNLARTHLDLLLDSPRPSPRTHILAAQLESLLGNRTRALELADLALRLEPGNPTSILAAVTLRSQSPRINEREEARKLLWPMARTNGPFRLHAMSVLLSGQETPRAEREELLGLISIIPNPSFEERILTYEIRASLDPSQSRALAEEAIRTLRPASEREIRLLVEWLVLHDYLPEALNLLAGQRVFRDRGLFLLRHRTLMMNGETQKGYDLLFNPAAPIPPFELETLRCQAASTLGNPRLRDEHLAAAAALAGSDVRNATAITQLAEFCQNLGPAIDTWRAVLRNPRTASLALRQLIRLAEVQGDTSGSRDFARQLARLEPSNPGPRRIIARTSLLLGDDLDAAETEIRNQLTSHPSDTSLHALLGLAHLRRHDPERARLAIRGSVIRRGETSPGTMAILAAVAAANNQMLEARRIMDRIPLQTLTPEERELLRPILAAESRLVSEPATP